MAWSVVAIGVNDMVPMVFVFMSSMPPGLKNIRVRDVQTRAMTQRKKERPFNHKGRSEIISFTGGTILHV